MSKSNLFTPQDTIGSAVISGDRPFSQRPFAKLALASAFIFSAAIIAPSTTHAADYPNTSAQVFDSQSTLSGQTVQTGRIVGIKMVMVRVNPTHQNSYVAPAVGGLIGAALGNQFTRHSYGAARTLGIAVGGIGGAAIGRSVSNMNNQPQMVQELQVFVQMDGRGNQVRGFVQANDQPGIQMGAEVAVVRSRNGAQGVEPMNLPQQTQDNGYGNPNNGSTRYVRDDGQSNIDNTQQVIRSGSYRP